MCETLLNVVNFLCIFFLIWVDSPDSGPQFLFFLDVLLVVNPDKSKKIPVFDIDGKHSIY